jgi:hypothetical protein
MDAWMQVGRWPLHQRGPRGYPVFISINSRSYIEYRT